MLELRGALAGAFLFSRVARRTAHVSVTLLDEEGAPQEAAVPASMMCRRQADADDGVERRAGWRFSVVARCAAQRTRIGDASG